MTTTAHFTNLHPAQASAEITPDLTFNMDPTHIKEPSEKEAALVEEQTVEDHHSMPDSLRSLTEEERRNIEKRVVRKADLVIMPIIGLLYILNCKSRDCICNLRLILVKTSTGRTFPPPSSRES
jgi:hypothetical protein